MTFGSSALSGVKSGVIISMGELYNKKFPRWRNRWECHTQRGLCAARFVSKSERSPKLQPEERPFLTGGADSAC